MSTSVSNPLASRAMLAVLNCGCWRPEVFHREESRYENARHNSGDAARVIVRLTNHPALHNLIKLHARARAAHYAVTLPTGQQGWRFLPVARVMEHSAMIQKFAVEHAALAAEFVKDWPAIVEQAPLALNGLCRAEFFPSIERVKMAMVFTSRYLEVPAVGQWQDWLREAAQIGEEDLRARLRDALCAIRDKLADSKQVFRDSLIGNLKALCELAGDLNLCNAADIARVVQQSHELHKTHPELLRQNILERQQARRRAIAILAALNP
jgi:hypothetical protein